MTQFLDAEAWYAGLPGVILAAGALITSPAGDVLLVKPNYRDHWSLPGGICEHGEPPHAGAAREVAEETGLRIALRRLLTIQWGQPRGPDERPIMHFIFDGGTVPADVTVVVQREELDGYAFVAAAGLADRLPPDGLARVRAAVAARADGTTGYLPAGGWQPAAT